MRNSGLAQIAEAVYSDALAECSVERAFAAKLQTADQPYTYTFRGDPAEAPIKVALSAVARVVVIAAGKGAATMLQGLLSQIQLPPSCELSGILVAPSAPSELPPGIEYFAGGHPLPAPQSFAAASAALSLIQQTAAHGRAFCFFLISGGASAMLELPLEPAISLDDTVAFHRALVHSGASIAEINCVRKHFSAIKGGRLGKAAATIPSLTLLVSDVPAGQLDALASGPTLPDTSTLAQCRQLLDRYNLLAQFPASVQRFFNSPELPETPKPGDFPARILTLLSSSDLAESARRAADAHGFTAVIDTASDDWDYRPAAEHLLARLRDLRSHHRRVCLIAPGEVTVQLPAGQSAGIGGRNQHFALYAATLLTPADHPTAIFSAGSDGIDGNSPFAGAVLDDTSLQAIALAQDALNRFDSSTFLSGIDATMATGPTGNNLRDLRLLLTDLS
jgi:hydroxypyruvate reductase